ncbi:MAG: GGDEF domain-containing protein [Chloroflexi bacterium]|nr:GGDEF domain-containing protein [Chloroflexota bacterium]
MNTASPSHVHIPQVDVPLLPHMILTLLGSTLLMAAFEVVKQLVLPAITLWQSHAITIVFGALLATACAYAVSRRQLLHQHTRKEIDDRKRSEEALAREQYLMQALMDSLPDAIFFKDLQSRFIRINAAAGQLVSIDPEHIVGKTDFDFFTREYAQATYEMEQEIIRTGRPVVDVEAWETSPDHPPRWVSTTKLPLRDEAGHIVGTFGVSRDITARKQAEEKLVYLSIHDALTGLYNRAYFEKVLAQLSHGDPYPISIVVFDIDGMKCTNDTEGHSAGDELLRRTATVLRSVCRQGDIIARIGGDEFALLLPQTDNGVAVAILDRLRHTLAEHNSSYQGKPLSLSMGTATAYEYGGLTQTIIAADRRMYRDKHEHHYQVAPNRQRLMD